MTTPLRSRLFAGLCLALMGVAGPVHAQLAPRPAKDTTVLPVWNHDSGRIEALLLLEAPDAQRDATDLRFLATPPAPAPGALVRRDLGATDLTAGVRLEPQSNLALLCNGDTGVALTLGGLAEHCMLAQMNDTAGGGGRLGLEATVGNDEANLTLGAGSTRGTVGGTALLPNPGSVGEPNWLANNPLLPMAVTAGVEQTDVGMLGQMRLGSDGWVSIAGTVARARLVPANDAAASLLPDQWDTTTLGVGAGYGAFSGSVIGRVIEVPGQDSFGSLGLGLSWRAPWRGQFSVGAENIVTRGKSPWSTSAAGEESEDGGRVPYVRYQQDL
ncbi:hypothetical protein [Coralloluteibacterium thermophilus]|uniref:Uncharacterized protein n=1 Tax=Coralloluteibacterium thermophilum TaxID=2707049 RepID=A0ABV9NK68_9GAMM